MTFGFTGKILLVDLTTGSIREDHPEEAFYRKYIGGPGIGLYYLLKHTTAAPDALEAENPLVFAAGILTGANAPAVPRFTVMAKSPLTGGLGRSEAGGWWGPELKRAGFDAIVITGQAEKPSYLWIKDGQVEIRDAAHLWGRQTGEVQEEIRSELKDEKIQVAQIGPAGENQVLFANITNNLGHFNGRNGMGAVMGSKNLKAIAVRGTGQLNVKNKNKMVEIFRWAAQQVGQHPLSAGLHEHGTPLGMVTMNAAGALPTRNWTTGHFDSAENLGSEKMNEQVLDHRGGCFACPVKCKRVVSVDTEELQVDKKYGGPEYESLGALGSNLGIGNLALVCKANELCNRYTMDVITAGMTISFAMECFEKGIIDDSLTDGMDLRFGNEEILLPLLEKIAKREGFGAILADGSRAAAEKFGEESKKYLLHVKGQEVPMHDPRLRNGLALQYALSPIGADHWFAQHDHLFVNKDSFGTQAMSQLGLSEPVSDKTLEADKVRHILYTSFLNSVYDLLGVCVFGYVARSLVTLDHLLDLVEAATGWETSWFELQKAGERALAMSREYNSRQGLNLADDKLPEKFFTPLTGKPGAEHAALSREEFSQARQLYYKMAGWDEAGGVTEAKRQELGLAWLKI
ncbi:aldehyde ferredoxin oxidoreductase family protein [Dethiobacter alkaliphilus]|uniref:aldehyde ferredoxin oxidoreductase family protein n=1 Tax=Dethiobacter alkaliphilus TaxID=427926 RepID=UPI002226219B|nr:aldehyde ferredoxin oxidoreductase family protein [Dethiobacter alkaliphilus]MCW3489010.1 aldehyde ferredoxin oxidoreductase family protein [Dethiobacter alkaliphilus]